MPLALGLIHTAATLPYTRAALASLRRWTPPPYRVLVVDNDGRHQADLLAVGADECLVPPAGPAPFAKNANALLARAGGDLVLLNNDVLFTPGWLEPLRRATATRPGLISPLSNFEVQVSVGEFSLRPTMSLEDVNGREEVVFAAARQVGASHRGQSRPIPFLRPFACYIPAVVGSTLRFDEGFVNGSEDDDLSIRAHLAGVPIYQVLDSFVLHFGQKSPRNDVEVREGVTLGYLHNLARMRAKWGPQITDLVWSAGDQAAIAGVLRAFQLEAAWSRGEYAECFRTLVAATRPNAS